MLVIDNVTQIFGQGRLILDEATCKINAGEHVGLVGPNGAGKSTLFNIITGQLQPHSGQVHIAKGARLGYLRQEPSAGVDRQRSVIDYCLESFEDLKALETQLHELEEKMAAGDTSEALLEAHGHLQHEFEERGGYQLRHRVEACLCGLGFHADELSRPLVSFSGGWQMRAELSRILVSEPEILLLDEPTNYLDVEAVEWLRDFLRRYAGTMLLISHDRCLLNTLTQSTVVLMNGGLRKFAGSYDQFLASFEQEAKTLEAAKKNQDRKKAQLERFVEQFKAKATKAAQARSKQRELDKMEEIDIPEFSFRPPKLSLPEPPHCGHELVRLEEVSKSYDGEKWIYQNLDLSITNGEKIAFVGWNGVGKTTLLRILSGSLPFESGERVLGTGVKIGYHSQEYIETMDPESTLWDTVRSKAIGWSDSQVRAMLGSFRFSGEDIEKRVSMLSGGEKVRLSFCRILVDPPNLLILDEPTSHLDIGTREVLQEALCDYKGAICLVSHDIAFIQGVAKEVIEVTPCKLTRFFGDYDYYREKKRELLAAENGEGTAYEVSGTGAVLKAAGKEKKIEEAEGSLSRKEQKRLEAERRNQLSKFRKPLEKRISAAETKMETLETEQQTLWDELSAVTDGEEIKQKNQRLAAIEAELEAAMTDWEAASLELEELLAD